MTDRRLLATFEGLSLGDQVAVNEEDHYCTVVHVAPGCLLLEGENGAGRILSLRDGVLGYGPDGQDPVTSLETGVWS